MAIDLERARRWIEEHGTPLDRQRLMALLGQDVPREVPDALRQLQNPDGGFPLGLIAGRPSALAASVQVLGWLRDLRLADSDVARRALAFIAERQTARGIWRESKALLPFALPPWSDPEAPAADVYTTALCAGTLATLAGDAYELHLDRAVSWLQSQQGRDGLLIGFRAHSSWLALPAFALILGHETRATRRLVGGLGNLLADSWTGAMLAWMLQALLDAGYTRRTELVNRAWQLLQAAQQPDGSFTGDEGDDPAQTILQALDVAQRIHKQT
ncbi:prenyltransferase/squalene oxidase repeat-containing protein [Kallotenue papyrolyticum]|uniref:prenyltransferase/squalene oxidase repeat-containing protein n=1 Tax=Kallotenue papyrolyticum TaxID=1325125 RepID=UPI0004785A2E|nr:prenyltransferase/squalene oxidase repeat-containing protein [Kallotenue papyrolyticum]